MDETNESPLERMRRRNERLREWEAANPLLTKAWDEAYEEGYQREEAAERAEAAQHRLQGAGVGSRAAKAWAGSLKGTEAIKAVREWLNGDVCFLLLSGDVGCGKTVAAVEAIATHYGRFWRAADASRLGAFGSEAGEELARMRSASLLVLDDLGTEFLADVWHANFDALVDYRYSEKKRTLLTTNLAPELFRERYGTRVADRIRHDGTVFRCGSTSMRRQQTPTPGDTDAD